MKKVLFLTLVSIMGFAVSANGQMNLKLSNDISYDQFATLGNHNLESNLKLELPSEVTALGSGGLVEGLWLIGLAADLSFPTGDMGDVFSTGFSAHAIAGYIIAKSILLNLSVGYVRFAENKDYQENYEITHTRIPILLTISYLINTRSKVLPFIGVALGLYIMSEKWTYSFEGFSDSQEYNDSKFGISPQVGAYYMASTALMISLALQYTIVFHEVDVDLGNYSNFAVLLGFMYALRN